MKKTVLFQLLNVKYKERHFKLKKKRLCALKKTHFLETRIFSYTEVD